MPVPSSLSSELKNLVHDSVALLGEVIKKEMGKKSFQEIEEVRQRMAGLRDADPVLVFQSLEKTQKQLAQKPKEERHLWAHSFALMLELMNACENAYRTFRLEQKKASTTKFHETPEAIIYVLTAHPTEARSPENIWLFHAIQDVLLQWLKEPEQAALHSQHLRHWLGLAWKTPLARNRQPTVKDEAESIYSIFFRDETFFELLKFSKQKAPLLMRSWVGGDKDGHPGVDEKTFLQSLTLSRGHILRLLSGELAQLRQSMGLNSWSQKTFLPQISKMQKQVIGLKILKIGDSKKVLLLQQGFEKLAQSFEKDLAALPESLERCLQIFKMFPMLVIPLELRESSDVLMDKTLKNPAIDRMLKTVAKISAGIAPRGYANSFIISMTESVDHILAAAQKQKAAFGDIPLPIVPLFENAKALTSAADIVTEMAQNSQIKKAAQKHWEGRLELMVGYSDSSKESGALSSRWMIAQTLPRLEKACEAQNLTPVFFHGSGGSVDRGGGSIEDQTAWWPRSALRRYKVTVQGEMIDRSFSTSCIALRQFDKIYESAAQGLTHPTVLEQRPALDHFTAKVSACYKEQIHSEKFLKMVEKATPYSYLKFLKIGSRPSKRSGQLQVSGLRAIPWILCWTQTRVLFPTWWGLGTAWEQTLEKERQQLKAAFTKEPVFTSYIKAVGFTLAKVEIGVWRLYLENSPLTKAEKKDFEGLFDSEFQKTLRFYSELTGQKELLWFRPWLGDSIRLRSSMIHPLNILQILSIQDEDATLMRKTVMGISSGMMTTG